MRAAILSGELAPGRKVSQVQLATEFGISRAPLREALRLLQSEHLIDAVHNRRMRIAPLTRDDLEELYAIRILTEPLAVALSVPLLDDDELDAVRGAHHSIRTAIDRGDATATRAAHRAFHLGLFARAGDRIRSQLADLWDHAERYRAQLLTAPAALLRAHLDLAAAEHTAMLEAAEARDGELCAARLTAHLTRVGLGAMATIDPTHEPQTLRVAIRGPAAATPTARASNLAG